MSESRWDGGNVMECRVASIDILSEALKSRCLLNTINLLEVDGSVDRAAWSPS